jgi:hypothetical protein
MNLSQKTTDLIQQAESLADQVNADVDRGVEAGQSSFYKPWDAAYTAAIEALSAEYLADPQRLAYAEQEGQILLDALCYVFGLRDTPYEPLSAGKLGSCAGLRLAKAAGRK